MNGNRPFYNVITHLRKQEEILFHTYLTEINPIEADETVAFLENEYQQEALDFPFQAPAFDSDAAIWAAKIIFFGSQLMLLREDSLPVIHTAFAPYTGSILPGTILSADLCLRFLPEVFNRTKEINDMDPILPIFEKILLRWHYSGMKIVKDEELDFSIILSDKCLSQLYVNRILQYKHKHLAIRPEIKPLIQASLGNHYAELKKELNL